LTENLHAEDPQEVNPLTNPSMVYSEKQPVNSWKQQPETTAVTRHLLHPWNIT